MKYRFCALMDGTWEWRVDCDPLARDVVVSMMEATYGKSNVRVETILSED